MDAPTSNFQRAMSMVIPRSRSALSLSSTHAYLNEPLPAFGWRRLHSAAEGWSRARSEQRDAGWCGSNDASGSD